MQKSWQANTDIGFFLVRGQVEVTVDELEGNLEENVEVFISGILEFSCPTSIMCASHWWWFSLVRELKHEELQTGFFNALKSED
jgi:hypothetical protein